MVAYQTIKLERSVVFPTTDCIKVDLVGVGEKRMENGENALVYVENGVTCELFDYEI